MKFNTLSQHQPTTISKASLLNWKSFLGILLLLIVFNSCNCGLKSDKDLSEKDKKFIKKLGLLEEKEKIILFNSQGSGFHTIKTSGNFFTDKRIASYWIDDQSKSKSHIEYAFYQEIDTIRRYPKYHSLTLASYLEVQKKDGTTFKVYVSEDSVTTWSFFNKALHQWCETTNKK
ncbi:MAG: hypothetical protein QM802_14060 [Agriterribacter sp.]